GGEYVAYAQTGEAAVYFYGETGEFQRKVPIEAWKGQIMFMDEPAENPAKAMLKSMGVKDLRTPLGGYISGVHVGETYTLVQGGLTTPQKLRTVALVDHSTWRVHYAELPVLCRSISLKGESFYCLLTREDKVLIEEFAI